jgi:hypothetical protein
MMCKDLSSYLRESKTPRDQQEFPLYDTAFEKFLVCMILIFFEKEDEFLDILLITVKKSHFKYMTISQEEQLATQDTPAEIIEDNLDLEYQDFSANLADVINLGALLRYYAEITDFSSLINRLLPKVIRLSGKFAVHEQMSISKLDRHISMKITGSETDSSWMAGIKWMHPIEWTEHVRQVFSDAAQTASNKAEFYKTGLTDETLDPTPDFLACGKWATDDASAKNLEMMMDKEQWRTIDYSKEWPLQHEISKAHSYIWDIWVNHPKGYTSDLPLEIDETLQHAWCKWLDKTNIATISADIFNVIKETIASEIVTGEDSLDEDSKPDKTKYDFIVGRFKAGISEGKSVLNSNWSTAVNSIFKD